MGVFLLDYDNDVYILGINERGYVDCDLDLSSLFLVLCNLSEYNEVFGRLLRCRWLFDKLAKDS